MVSNNNRSDVFHYLSLAFEEAKKLTMVIKIRPPLWGTCTLLKVAVSHFFVMCRETEAHEVNAKTREKSKIYGNGL